MSGEKRLTSDRYIGHGKHIEVGRRFATSYPLHAHEFFEAEIVISGEGKHILNGVEYPIQPGSAYVLSPSDFHSVEIKEAMEVYHIAFDETVIPPHILQAVYNENVCRVLTEEEMNRVSVACDLMCKEFNSWGYHKPLCDYVLSMLTRSNRLKVEITPVRKAILYVETHFRENPTLAEAAAQACLSPVYFGNVFKQITGETYISFLNARKITCAKMLLESGCSVTEACFAAGFGSLSGFLHTFKKRVGVSPEQYKNSCKKSDSAT